MTRRPDTARIVLAPVSIGELVDKITILEIKSERIGDAGKKANVDRELEALARLRDELDLDPAVAPLAAELAAVNRRLWVIEDALRAQEAEGRFDAEFVALARSVYRENDRRAALKKQISLLARSAIVEEKSH